MKNFALALQIMEVDHVVLAARRQQDLVVAHAIVDILAASQMLTAADVTERIRCASQLYNPPATGQA